MHSTLEGWNERITVDETESWGTIDFDIDFDAETKHDEAVRLYNEARDRLDKSMKLEDFTFTGSITKEEARHDIICSNTVNATLGLALESLCGAFPSEQWPLLIEIIEFHAHDAGLLQETFDELL